MSKEKPGPTSETGKRIASQNAAKHHMTGRVLLIKDEKQSDLDALLAQWQEEYPTDTVEAAKLVQEAANSEWILFRVQRGSDKTFLDLFQKGMEDWDEGDHKRYQLTQRYLTAAERKVERNRRLIWQYRREVRADAREKRAALLFAARYEVDDAPKPESAPQPRKLSNTPIPQDAYVSVKDGKTVTFLSPPNDTVLRARALRAPETLVKREIHFHCDEIPAEYAFCIPRLAKFDAPLRKKVCRVFLTMRTFQTAIEREAASGGHVKDWPDLYDQDKQFIEEALAKQ